MTVDVSCPICQDGTVEVEVVRDRGCRYTKNGDGWPPSDSFSIVSCTCACWEADRTDTETANLEEAALEQAAEATYDPKWDYEERD